MSNYNAYDIERYLNRQMNAAEMHAFEKAMMNDPFLADAVDGFRTVVPQQNIQHDLELLQERINRKKENGKVVSGFTRPWMQMAAVAIILLSAGVILYRFLNSPVANEQSTVSEKPKSTAPVISQPTVVDSAAVAINEVQPQENHTLLLVSKKMKLPAAPCLLYTSDAADE